MAHGMADCFQRVVNGARKSPVCDDPFVSYLAARLDVSPQILSTCTIFPSNNQKLGKPWVEGDVDDEGEEEEFLGSNAGGDEEEELDFGEQHHQHQDEPEHVVPSPPLGGYYYGPPYLDNIVVMNRMESMEQTMGQFMDLMLDTRRKIRGHVLVHRMQQHQQMHPEQYRQLPPRHPRRSMSYQSP
ncbi:hypothetical protein L1987_19125 [Smallanthus sonchifolius]|uniref:Uncharacterized protein n=1 Tax=Smallanthus sonchifolius TaxID=185202 RepID=A0ACB9J218_9ASTR|nr:hypothetical protein L1987_19125 [Smallanthus sonchifolius]